MKSQPNIILEDDHTIAAFIGLGSNLDSESGDRSALLKRAICELSRQSIKPIVVSSFYESEPVDCPLGSRNFVNAVAAVFLPIDTDVEAYHGLLCELEEKLGRKRTGIIHEPRTIDLDLLYFGCESVSLKHLEVPHPRALQRRFVMLPLSEIAPELVLPEQTISVLELLSKTPQKPEVCQINL